MKDATTAIDRLRVANPIPTIDAVPHDEMAAAIASADDAIASDVAARRAATAAQPVVADWAPRRRRVPRSAAAFAAAFVAIIVSVTVAAIIGSNDTVEPADELVPTMILDLAAPDVTAAQATPIELTPSRTMGGVSIIDGVEFYGGEDVTLEMSIYYPTEGAGPWPMIVRFHDFCSTCNDSAVPLLLAQQGVVVFAPSWVPEKGTPGEYVDGYQFDRAACAIGTAQRLAPGIGGDPTRTTVMGHAGGEHPAAWAGLGVIRKDVCADPILHPPTGLVIGQMQLIFQQDMWDDAFDDPGTNARDTLNRLTDSDRWQPADDLSVLLWMTDYAGNSRVVSPSGMDHWLAHRDPSGDLATDLGAVGALDDEVILLSDNALLMHHRMSEAGMDVRLLEYPYGGGIDLDLIGEIVAVASRDR